MRFGVVMICNRPGWLVLMYRLSLYCIAFGDESQATLLSRGYACLMLQSLMEDLRVTAPGLSRPFEWWPSCRSQYGGK